MIELDSITVALPFRRPDAETILDNLSLKIERGEWIALTGPNGSGKTTLLKTIAGLIPLASGSLSYKNGRPNVALLLQEPDNQFVASSVRNELLLSLPCGLSQEDRRHSVAEAAERFSLSTFLNRNPHRLSGGEKQRVALATVWLASPHVLLLDEPTSYLDEVERERCTRFVRELNREGVVVIWATPGGQDLPNSRRVLYLEDGRLHYDGTPEGFAASKWAADPVGHIDSETPPLGAAVVAREANPIVSLERVAFGYDDLLVLDDLSFAVHAGESVGINGRNGSGKSTLLGLLSGALEPTGGKITRSFSRPAEHGQQQVFYLFQNPERLFFAETVFEEVAFGLRALGAPKRDIPHRVAGALSQMGLEPPRFIDRSPLSLSFGEMRRLAFAIALVLKPSFLLLDEPASCLDASGREILADLVRHFQGEKSAVVIASHDVTEFGGGVDRRIAI